MYHKFKNDREILEALQRGDQPLADAAWKHLYLDKKIIGAIRKQIRLRGGDDQIALEMLNEALLELDKKLQEGAYDPSRGQISTFLVAVAAQKFYTLQRSAQRRVAMYERSGAAAPADLTMDPEYEMARQHKRSVLEQAMSGLSEKCQKVLDLRGNDFSMIEIAEQMGYKSTDVAKTAVLECRKRLHEILIKRPDLRAELFES
jgi:RNA polymerase sigma factor (sigma-70 family)